ncbi:hypothetical protein G6F46_014164 [Rhizopus delemar]|uniref:Uncharacterized protein n=1 Tax=Rhizopus delemar TaxID=936053 RepID=A0A9P7C2J1_9FUNG|nr:hypothetical protein G6F50_016028 [Rhizopus delemar]KAG1598655.1 hypothetical protein G6F46_014164 [Rhizopus delemar]
MQTTFESQLELQQRYLKTLPTSKKMEVTMQSLWTSSKRPEDLPYTVISQQIQLIKKPETYQQPLSDSHQICDTFKKKKNPTRNWHSLQSLSKKFNKLVMNSKSFEAPSNIDRMDLEDEEASEVAFPTINEEISSVQKLFWQRQRENQPATGDKL